MEDIARKIEFHTKPIVEQLDLELWGIDIQAGGRTVVCVYLEKAGIDECTQVSRLLGLVLDIEELFEDAWVLEVSTPGMDRIFFNIDQLEAYKGQVLSVQFNQPMEFLKGRKKVQGKLVEVFGDKFLLFVEDLQENINVEWVLTKKVKCVPQFEEAKKPITKTKAIKKEITE